MCLNWQKRVEKVENHGVCVCICVQKAFRIASKRQSQFNDLSLNGKFCQMLTFSNKSLESEMPRPMIESFHCSRLEIL